jgi:predicted O-methyltransferase YrrM
MTEEIWSNVDRYITDSLVHSDAALEATLSSSDAAGLPSINVAPNHGKLLHMLALMVGAKRILEIGTLGGYSTIWMARALPEDGRLVTLEADPKHAALARRNIDAAGVGPIVEIQLGKALDFLPVLAGTSREPFDLIFIDADKRQYAEFFAAALPLAHRGTLIIADNVVREGGVADPGNTDESVEGIRRFFAAVVHEPRVSATVLQTVGEKGHDGWAVMVVTSDEGRPPGRA